VEINFSLGILWIKFQIIVRNVLLGQLAYNLQSGGQALSMNREPFFLKRKLNIAVIKPIAYKFKSTNSIRKVRAYIEKCIYDGVSFDTDGIYPSLVDKVLSEILREGRASIIVKTEKDKRLLSILLNIRRIHLVTNIPSNVENVICYCGVTRKDIPTHINILTTILSPKG